MRDIQIENYKSAIVEAKRFIERAEAAIEAITPSDSINYHTWYSKCNASAKRASMDLTNALVLIRKSHSWN